MWHKLTQAARDAGDLVVLGVIQEQHPDRCILFAQWKEFDWPILQDPINLLNARAVPMFVAIDEAGVVVDANLKASELDSFIARPKDAAANDTGAQTITKRPRVDTEANLQDAAELIKAGDDQVLWGDSRQVSRAIDLYRKATELSPENGAAHFRLGVALRVRFDSTINHSDDFQAAVNAWGQALDLDPNHYIYRRRIQQYGPRLIKPYPFYDWIRQARDEITARGQQPHRLVSEPVGAEIAQPSKDVQPIASTTDPPDPDGRIRRDNEGFVRVAVTVVPGEITPGDAVRVHLQMRPSGSAHWNNEADPVKVWIDLPEGWQAESPLHELPQPGEPESREPRDLDFELRSPPDADGRAIPAYALYYVCDDRGGQCLYRRIDIEIPIQFRK